MTSEERVRTLDEVAPALVKAYHAWKAAEEAKTALKDEFFALADAALAKQGLAVKLVDVVAEDEAAARHRVDRHYPEWRIQILRKRPNNDPRAWEAVLIENPSVKPFAFEHEGVKLARQISKGSVMVDDEWLLEEDADLYDEVTFTLPWGEIVPLPVETLSAETLGRLTPYCYYSKPSARLAAPREVKE